MTYYSKLIEEWNLKQEQQSPFNILFQTWDVIKEEKMKNIEKKEMKMIIKHLADRLIIFLFEPAIFKNLITEIVNFSGDSQYEEFKIIPQVKLVNAYLKYRKFFEKLLDNLILQFIETESINWRNLYLKEIYELYTDQFIDDLLNDNINEKVLKSYLKSSYLHLYSSRELHTPYTDIRYASREYGISKILIGCVNNILDSISSKIKEYENNSRSKSRCTSFFGRALEMCLSAKGKKYRRTKRKQKEEQKENKKKNKRKQKKTKENKKRKKTKKERKQKN